jgi:hypothetical protein
MLPEPTHSVGAWTQERAKSSRLRTLLVIVTWFLAFLSAPETLGAASVVSAESDGSKVTLTLHVPGGDLDAVRLYRLETGGSFYTRMKANLALDPNGEWIEVRPRPTSDPNRFLLDDAEVRLGGEYCYVNSTSGIVTIDGQVCVINQQVGASLQFPAAPDLRVTQVNVHNLTLEYRDSADNETQFIIERRFQYSPQQAIATLRGLTGTDWEAIATLPALPGTGERRSYKDSSVEMDTRYCYRVRAINADGARPSLPVCVRTDDVIVPLAIPPQSGAGVLAHISHHRENGLAVRFIFRKVNFDRTFTINLFLRETLDSQPERSVILRVSANSSYSQRVTFFEGLDPTRIYCARIETKETNTKSMRVLCESPFGKRTQAVDLGPTAGELPVIEDVINGRGFVRLQISNPNPGMLVDMVAASNSQRRTRLDRAEENGEIIIEGIVGMYCFRPFVTNTYGSRYGHFVCGTALSDGSDPPVGTVTLPEGASEGLDCGCKKTGPYIDPVPMASGVASSDGAYRVELTSNSISVVSNSDNVQVFHQGALAPGFQFGFGPRTQFFVVTEPQDNNRHSLSVNNLKLPAGTQQVFLDSIIDGSFGFGFSSDGRTFVLGRISGADLLTFSLVNLDLDKTKVITTKRPICGFDDFSNCGFFQFSPCGDAFAVGLILNPVGMPFVSLYRTVDGKALKTGLNLPANFARIASTESNHVIVRGSGNPIVIASNNAGDECPFETAVTYPLAVRRYQFVSLSNNEADTIFAAASKLLKDNDGPNDVACDVTFERSGDVLFSAGPTSIDSEAELNAVLAAPGNVKAVEQINFCDGMGSNIIGCAGPGNSLVFMRTESENTTVPHEFGHTKGLEHRNDDPDALMYEDDSGAGNKVNSEECAAFKSQVAPAANFYEFELDQPFGGDGEFVDVSATRPLLPIQDFVRRIYFEGVPYQKVRQYDETVVPVLLRMLDDPGESKYWSNIVVTLGMLGDERAVRPLISFIEKDSVAPSRDEYRAKAGAILSLGYVVNRRGDQVALNYLKSSTDPNVWRERAIVGRAPYQDSDDARNEDFSKSAVLGLALAGTPEARAILESLLQPGVTLEQQHFRKAHADLIAEAIRENRLINEIGLARYYLIDR